MPMRPFFDTPPMPGYVTPPPADRTPEKPAKERLEWEAKKPRNGQLPCFGIGSGLNEHLSAPPMYAAHPLTQLDEAEEELLPACTINKEKLAQSPSNWKLPSHAHAQASNSSSNSSDAQAINSKQDLLGTLSHSVSHHGGLHCQALEKEVKELRSRSISLLPASEEMLAVFPPESRQDLAVVVGGWKDARRSEIQEGMAAFLSQLKLNAEMAEVSVPFVRSTWARRNLAIPLNMSLNEA